MAGLLVACLVGCGLCLAPRGVAPAKAHYYSVADGSFTCTDKSKSISLSLINDDYCDCEDGSDEPGTAACTLGKFHCLNEQFKGTDIPSARVNDGVCDCCDGSDETAGTCLDTCAALHAVHEVRMQAERKEYYAAAQIRSERINEAKEWIASSQAQMESLQSSLQESKQQLISLEQEKNKQETLEAEALQALEQKFSQELHQSWGLDDLNATQLQAVVVDVAMKWGVENVTTCAKKAETVRALSKPKRRKSERKGLSFWPSEDIFDFFSTLTGASPEKIRVPLIVMAILLLCGLIFGMLVCCENCDNEAAEAKAFLHEVYRVNNPAKLADVEDILDMYRSDYHRLVQDVQSKYNLNGDDDDNDDDDDDEDEDEDNDDEAQEAQEAQEEQGAQEGVGQQLADEAIEGDGNNESKADNAVLEAEVGAGAGAAAGAAAEPGAGTGAGTGAALTVEVSTLRRSPRNSPRAAAGSFSS